MTQQKLHHGVANGAIGYIMLSCQHGKVGRSKRITLPSFGNKYVLAYTLATDPESVCEHCAVIVKKKYSQSVAKAAANPQAFYDEFILCK